MIIKLLIEGGDMKPGPAIAQQLGPMGINMGKVISEVNAETKGFKGMKVPVELNVDEKTKDFTIKALSPPTSELLKKEFDLEKGSADQKVRIVNASIEDIIKIAKIKHSNMLEKEFKSAVKSILGTCATIGIMVENRGANELVKDIGEHNKFHNEIEEQSIETSPEKREKLKQFFDKVQEAQEAKQKLAEKAAEEAEAAKVKEGETPEEGAKETTEEPKTESKTESSAEPEAKK